VMIAARIRHAPLRRGRPRYTPPRGRARARRSRGRRARSATRSTADPDGPRRRTRGSRGAT
jgi:hypothetical protein